MTLREQAIAIWKAGVAAVDSSRLVREQFRVGQSELTIAGQRIPLASLRHIEVVGAGKAGAGMAAGIEAALDDLPPHISSSGWVNVPADCVQPRNWIRLHPARPPGRNEPTAAGVEGTTEILRRVSGLSRDDVCIVLLSGGGSALLCAPAAGVDLSDKVALTRALAAAGAPIQELNAVRTRLSRVKGGGLRRHCSAGWLIALIISDVVGDPLDVIASGPTVLPSAGNELAPDVQSVLETRGIRVSTFAPGVQAQLTAPRHDDLPPDAGATPPERVFNLVIGNNATALDAAAQEAERRGFRVVSLGSDNQQEAAAEGRILFEQLQTLRNEVRSGEGLQPVCLLSGGEPVVRLAETSLPRSGGRNQELVLAALAAFPDPAQWSRLVLLSGGTDGEDGPTNAAGAVADRELVQTMRARGLNPNQYLAVNNSYPFFRDLDGLLITGPTHTNVMDLRVGLVGND